VETAGGSLPVSCGLRLNLYGAAHSAADSQELRALAKARPPRNFLDPAAFDLRGYFARQQIDLTGSLRSGANSFGHPAENVIERYEQAGVRLLRTDRDGAITAITDGQALSAHAYAER
jgi:hypothetical protein